MKAFPPVDALDGGLFFFAYENVIKEAIHKIKFEQDKKLPELLSEETEMLLTGLSEKRTRTFFWADAGKNPCCAEKDCTDRKPFRALYQKEVLYHNVAGRTERDAWLWTGIPTDAARLRQRGFDLPTELFSNSAERFGGIWIPLLCRTRKTLPMYGLSPEARKRNLQDCFAVTGHVRGKDIMLVDDIFTTGTTFSAAASVLKDAGAATVTGMAFCGSVENLR